jgi:hypothetical protein
MESGIREAVVVEDSRFVFALCRKAEQMGPVPVDHWWMRATELYRQRAWRRQRGGNHEAVTEAFWALCCRGGAHHESDVQESYLLSKLLPHARSQGSRRVFADAYLESRPRAGQVARLDSLADLGQMIRASNREGLTRLDFQRKTGEALGPPELAPEAVRAYQEFCEDLFGTARAALAADQRAGEAVAVAGWERVMRSVGRRGGQALQKQVLDILSYEARASLHRCYSAVWDMLLLPLLQQKYSLSPESLAFLRLWHLDQASESNLGNASYFHLFHGHVFALHPACGEFLRTEAGRELMGRWLRRPSERVFGRLLHGLYVAVLHYAGRRAQAASDRQKQPRAVGGPDLVGLEQQKVQRRTGRRPRHRSDSD